MSHPLRLPAPVPGSPAWIELHRSGIGATAAAKITGHSQFGSPFDVFLELAGMTAPLIANEAMEWGTILEPVILRQWGQKAGRKVRACRWTYFHPLRSDIFSHFDGETWDENGTLELVEVKATGSGKDFGEEDTDQVPEGYAIQCQHEMMLRPGVPRTHLVLFGPGLKVRRYIIERNPELIEALFTIESAFLDATWAGIAPRIDGSEAASHFLSLTTHDDGSKIELDSATEDIAREYLAEKATEKAAKERIKLLGNVLRAAMGDASAATGTDLRIRYAQNKDSVVVEWPAIASAYRQMLVDAGADIALADAIEARCTSTKPGLRPLVVDPIEG